MTYGDPDWASPGAATAEIPSAPTVNNSAVSGNPVQRPDRSGCVHRLISIVLIGLCVSMSALGVLAILQLESIQMEEITEFFIATYMVVFAALLFLYEMMWWCTIDSVNKIVRKNFGFMYKVYGKALYLIFVALLCLGLDKKLLQENMAWLQWFTGISWAATGCVLLFLVWCRPNLFENYKSPTGGYLEEAGAV